MVAAKNLTHTLSCSMLLSVACADPSTGDDGPVECVAGNLCPDGLVCVSGFCVFGDDESSGGDGDGDGDGNGDGDGDDGNGDGDGDDGNGDGDGDGGDGDGDGGDGDGDGGDGDGDADGCTKADILFVIDNSGSMLEEQIKLTSSFPTFIDGLEGLNLDYHIMVVDVDAWVYEQCGLLCQFPDLPEDICVGYQCGVTVPAVCEDVVGAGVIHPKGFNSSNMNCNFVGGGRFMTSAEPNPVATFTCAARVGTDSTSEPERPMEAMSQAVASVGQAATCNTGFLRDDAILAVIFLTDENDEVGDGSAGTPETWRQALINAKQGNEAAISVVGVFGDNDLPNAICGTQAEEAPRLREFVDSWGPQGFFKSICAASYDGVYESALDLIDTTCSNFAP